MIFPFLFNGYYYYISVDNFAFNLQFCESYSEVLYLGVN